MIRISVLFLGPAKDLAAAETVMLEVAEGSTVADLRSALSTRYSRLGRALPTIRFAINEEFAVDDTVLHGGDAVALIPPVSGGATDDTILVDLVTDPVDAQRVRDFVMGDPLLGGIVTFEGATRRDVDPEHGAILRLDYEAYESMTRQQLQRLAGEARKRRTAGRVAIIHRLGSIPPGEVALMIAVACGHRAEAFEACRWLIDTIKKEVPIWKKDVFEDGYVRWVQPEQTG
ncbi:MAG: molybdenum cofactor biosynthesis protein MoaE [Phycisphaerales bacterium]|nr:MAG: molybdenum cofactor biosynthesis protein MoaE [Phycisphaerales bacterium]